MNAFLQQTLELFRRNPFVIICCAVSVLLGIAYYFILQNQRELAAGHQALQRNGEEMLQALTNQGRIASELASVKEALAFIDRNLITEADLPENKGYFYQLESASRLRLQSLNQLNSAPTPPDQPYKTVPFTLRTSGSYRQVLRFLRELETGPRLYKVQTYSIVQGGAGAPTGDASNLVTLDLTIEVLARP